MSEDWSTEEHNEQLDSLSDSWPAGYTPFEQTEIDAPSVDYFLEQKDDYVVAVSNRYTEALDSSRFIEYALETEKDPDSVAGPRASRGVHKVFEVYGDFSIVLRKYMRGGLTGKVVKDLFVVPPSANVEQLRPFKELDIHEYLFLRGVRVPAPVAAAVRWHSLGVSYNGFIATEQIEGAKNLLEWGDSIHGNLAECEKFSLACYAAGAEARKTLITGVLHTDLHLGNVLIDSDDEVYLIDFDKARYVAPKSFRRIIVNMCNRWDRSATKHGLMAHASGAFRRGMFEPGDFG